MRHEISNWNVNDPCRETLSHCNCKRKIRNNMNKGVKITTNNYIDNVYVWLKKLNMMCEYLNCQKKKKEKQIEFYFMNPRIRLKHRPLTVKTLPKTKRENIFLIFKLCQIYFLSCQQKIYYSHISLSTMKVQSAAN